MAAPLALSVPAQVMAEENAAEITILVKTLTGKIIPIRIAEDATILDVKRAVQRKEGIPTNQQRLIHAGKQLADERALPDYGIGNEASLFLVLRLGG